MKELLAQSPPDILQCGLHPTFDQIEMYAYHLPQASLANLIDIFASLSVIDDSLYSLCQMEDFKFLADMIEHIKLPLKAKYTFCCAPINRKMPLVCTMFMKIVRQYRYVSCFYDKNLLVYYNYLANAYSYSILTQEYLLKAWMIKGIN